jgi:hypothetical protein
MLVPEKSNMSEQSHLAWKTKELQNQYQGKDFHKIPQIINLDTSAGEYKRRGNGMFD